jgi:hypothetical protein
MGVRDQLGILNGPKIRAAVQLEVRVSEDLCSTKSAPAEKDGEINDLPVCCYES